MTATWATSTVGDQFDVQLGKMLDSSKNAGVPKPYLGNRAVQWGRIDVSACGVVPMSRSDLQRYRLRDGDLLVCEGGDVGRGAIWRNELPECYYQKALHRLRAKNGYDARLMLALLAHWSSTGAFADFVTQTSIAHLPREKFVQMPLPLPSKAEQRRIGDVLQDADSLIATLERLITKKQAIKQGMMQQLLTGRTRLPGYTEDWPSVTLGGSGVVAGGGVDKTSSPTEASVLLLNYMDVYRMEFIDHQAVTQVVTAPSPKIAKCSIRAGDIFFTPTSETPDDIARFAVADDDLPGVVYSYHLVRWRPGPGWDRSYLAYAFSTNAFRSQASTLAAGSGTRYVVSMPGFRSLVVPQPPVDEQRAIGEALRDASSEINVLFRRLAKARAIKQGMMQQLLTGRTRLHSEVSS